MTTNPLDAPPDDELARAYRLPDVIAADPELLALYQTLVSRLRAEALGLPLTTAQYLLIERIATKYVIIRYREQNGWLGVNAEKDTNQQWLDLLKEWNRVLASSQEQMRAALLEQVTKIALDAVGFIKDTEDRQNVRRHFQEQFAAIGY